MSILRNFSLRLGLFLVDQWPLKWMAHGTLESVQDNPLLAKRNYLDICSKNKKKIKLYQYWTCGLRLEHSISLYVWQSHITCTQGRSPEVERHPTSQRVSTIPQPARSLSVHRLVSHWSCSSEGNYRFHCLLSSKRQDRQLKWFLPRNGEWGEHWWWKHTPNPEKSRANASVTAGMYSLSALMGHWKQQRSPLS